MKRMVWEPLPPGTHEDDNGTVYIEADGHCWQIHQVDIRGFFDPDVPKPTTRYRLCRLVETDVPSVPVTPEVREALDYILTTIMWDGRSKLGKSAGVLRAWLDGLEQAKGRE